MDTIKASDEMSDAAGDKASERWMQLVGNGRYALDFHSVVRMHSLHFLYICDILLYITKIDQERDAMVREIMKDESFLAQKAEPATQDDLDTAQDLLDTLTAHKDGCVGMAANMIGINKRIIVFDNDGSYMLMFNPEIIKRSDPYMADEGCLSLTGVRKAKRWKSIKVQYQNEKFQTRFKTFTGWTAQIIQHEIDHCEGIII